MSTYIKIYELCVPHMIEEEAAFVAAALSLMPPERALALLDRAVEEVKAKGKAEGAA